MRLLRITSVQGLPAFIGNSNTRLTTIEGSLSIINGDDATEGSINKAKADSNAYADSKVNDVDLSQVETNRLAIATLNAPVDGDGNPVDGSVIKIATDLITPVKTDLDSEISAVDAKATTNATDIATLNGDSDTVGSIKHEVKSIVGTAPETLDTFGEIDDALQDVDDTYAAMAVVIADNKTAAENSVADLNTKITDARNDFDSAIADEKTRVNDKIIADIGASEATADTKYFQVGNLLAELDTDDKRSSARSNLDVMSTGETLSYANSIAPTFKDESITVDSNLITLPDVVDIQHVFSIRLLSSDSSFDEIAIVKGENPGEFVVNDEEDGDLDGIAVQVAYVIPNNL